MNDVDRAEPEADRPDHPVDVRPTAVAGTFYPADPVDLGSLVDRLVGSVGPRREPRPAGLLVPHAGLVYSGRLAAAAWRLLEGWDGTVVLLGTNHSYPYLAGCATWDGDAWGIPGGSVVVDRKLAAAVAGLGVSFLVDRDAHAREHSLEVQLPVLARLAPGARIVPIAVSLGTGGAAIEAGSALGALLGVRRSAGERIVLAISTDMAHYPPARVSARITESLVPHLVGLDPRGLARAEAAAASDRSVVCGMCGIEPSVVGLAALAAMGAGPGRLLVAATSADAGGDPARTVGYCSIAWPG